MLDPTLFLTNPDTHSHWRTLVLSRDQLYCDAPNYFALLFRGSGLSETTNGTKEAVLHRDPHLLQISPSYLSGYPVMPLPENWFPRYMSKDVALLNLIADARFYGLGGLVVVFRAAPAGQTDALFL